MASSVSLGLPDTAYSLLLCLNGLHPPRNIPFYSASTMMGTVNDIFCLSARRESKVRAASCSYIHMHLSHMANRRRSQLGVVVLVCLHTADSMLVLLRRVVSVDCV